MNGRISAARNQNMSPLLLICNFHTLLSKFSVLLKKNTKKLKRKHGIKREMTVGQNVNVMKKVEWINAEILTRPGRHYLCYQS